MYICFAEYKIAAGERDAYLAYVHTLMKEPGQNVQLYEGTDQFSLFVEIWTAATEEEAEAIKKNAAMSVLLGTGLPNGFPAVRTKCMYGHLSRRGLAQMQGSD